MTGPADTWRVPALMTSLPERVAPASQAARDSGPAVATPQETPLGEWLPPECRADARAQEVLAELVRRSAARAASVREAAKGLGGPGR